MPVRALGQIVFGDGDVAMCTGRTPDNHALVTFHNIPAGAVGRDWTETHPDERPRVRREAARPIPCSMEFKSEDSMWIVLGNMLHAGLRRFYDPSNWRRFMDGPLDVGAPQASRTMWRLLKSQHNRRKTLTP